MLPHVVNEIRLSFSIQVSEPEVVSPLMDTPFSRRRQRFLSRRHSQAFLVL